MRTDVDLAGAEALRTWVIGKSVGAITVLDASYRFDSDMDGERLLILRVVVTDPPEGHASWPIDDVMAFHRLVKTEALRLLECRWYTTFIPEHPEPLADDDDEYDDGEF